MVFLMAGAGANAAFAAERTFAGLRAPTLSSSAPQPLGCSTPKCLTIYVAPWCPYCRAATPMILALRDYLKKHGVDMRVIVGLDKERPVRKYAEVFGPDTFLDTDGRIQPPGGVPNFIVSDASGRVLRSLGGAPPSDEPFTDVKLAQIAASYGLP